MFRSMIKVKKHMTQEAIEELLNKNEFGIVSVNGDEGYPYGVPVNFVYVDSKIYFHCAFVGHKIDSIKKDPKVSFCTMADTITNSKEFDTKFKSIIAFGKAEIVSDEEEKIKALEAIMDKYSPQYRVESREYIEKFKEKTLIVAITVEHITGKQSPV